MNNHLPEEQTRAAASTFFQRLVAPHPSIVEIGARRRAQALAALSLIGTVGLAIALIFGLVSATLSPLGIFTLSALILAALTSYFLSRSRSRLYLTGGLIFIFSLAAAAYWLVGNHADPERILLTVIPLTLILASLLLPLWGIALLSGSIVLASFAMILVVPGLDPSILVLDGGAFFVMGVAILATVAFRNSYEQHRVDTANKASSELQILRSQLEQQVAERTSGLESRNAALKAVNDFTNLANQARQETDLLEQSVQLLGKLYVHGHIGIFLVDDLKENAILRASNSSDGAALISNRYQLNVMAGEANPLGAETDLLTYRFGRVVYRVTRPSQLRDKQANLVFPIAVAEQLLGILNIQPASTAPALLEAETLQAFADQTALALQNIRLMAQLERRSAEVSQLAAQAVRSSWDRILHGGALGYHYDQLHILPTNESFPQRIVRQLQQGKTSDYMTGDNPAHSRLVAPIVLRDEVLGVIGYEDPDPAHEWQPEEIALLETVAARVALALENTRLVNEAQIRADREQMLGQVNARLRASMNIDTVLQTAVQEFKRSLNLEQAEVRLQISGLKAEEKRRTRRGVDGKVNQPESTDNVPGEA